MRLKLSTVSQGYGPILIFALLVAAAFLVHGGSALNYAFPMLTFALALYLFSTTRNVYVAFVWWIWLLAPFVRRMVDYQSGYHATSPVLTAPLLATLPAALPVLLNPRSLVKRRQAPLLLIGIVYIYALVNGLVQNGPVSAIFEATEAFLPALFGLFIMADPKRYAEAKDSFVFAVLFGLLVISLYGLYQFYNMPPWDKYWLAQSHFASAGSGEAEQIRLFGTLNSPGPYGTVLMFSLLFVVSTEGWLRIIAGGFGFAAFGLSLVRSDWGGWALGAVFIVLYMRGKARLRFIMVASVVAVIALPLVTVGPVADRLANRFQTFNNIQQDGSYKARQKLYAHFWQDALDQPTGIGFGGNGSSTKLSSTTVKGFDSGILEIPFQMGWVFGALFLWALIQLNLRSLGRAMSTRDPIALTGAAIFFVSFLELIAAPQYEGVNGMTSWIGLAFALGPFAERRRLAAAQQHALAVQPAPAE